MNDIEDIVKRGRERIVRMEAAASQESLLDILRSVPGVVWCLVAFWVACAAGVLFIVGHFVIKYW